MYLSASSYQRTFVAQNIKQQNPTVNFKANEVSQCVSAIGKLLERLAGNKSCAMFMPKSVLEKVAEQKRKEYLSAPFVAKELNRVSGCFNDRGYTWEDFTNRHAEELKKQGIIIKGIVSLHPLCYSERIHHSEWCLIGAGEKEYMLDCDFVSHDFEFNIYDILKQLGEKVKVLDEGKILQSEFDKFCSKNSILGIPEKVKEPYGWFDYMYLRNHRRYLSEEELQELTEYEKALKTESCGWDK